MYVSASHSDHHLTMMMHTIHLLVIIKCSILYFYFWIFPFFMPNGVLILKFANFQLSYCQLKRQKSKRAFQRCQCWKTEVSTGHRSILDWGSESGPVQTSYFLVSSSFLCSKKAWVSCWVNVPYKWAPPSQLHFCCLMENDSSLVKLSQLASLFSAAAAAAALWTRLIALTR